MEAEEEAREEAAEEAVKSKKLPSGTCRATNPELKTRGDAKAQQHWNDWCDENCVAEKWGGIGAGACKDGSMTGTVGCVCNQKHDSLQKGKPKHDLAAPSSARNPEHSAEYKCKVFGECGDNAPAEPDMPMPQSLPTAEEATAAAEKVIHDAEKAARQTIEEAEATAAAAEAQVTPSPTPLTLPLSLPLT